MRKILLSLTALVLTSIVALGANLPFIQPGTSPALNEPSQIISTLNTFINQLNGNAGWAPAQTVSLGQFCTNTAGGSPQTCNGQRGQVLFTGLGVTTTGSVMTTVVNDSSITVNSVCTAQWMTAFTAGSGVTVATAVPTAGVLTVVSVNAGTTANAVTTGTLAFLCQ